VRWLRHLILDFEREVSLVAHRMHIIFHALLVLALLSGCAGSAVMSPNAQEPITSDSISEISTRYRNLVRLGSIG